MCPGSAVQIHQRTHFRRVIVNDSDHKHTYVLSINLSLPDWGSASTLWLIARTVRSLQAQLLRRSTFRILGGQVRDYLALVQCLFAMCVISRSRVTL